MSIVDDDLERIPLQVALVLGDLELGQYLVESLVHQRSVSLIINQIPVEVAECPGLESVGEPNLEGLLLEHVRSLENELGHELELEVAGLLEGGVLLNEVERVLALMLDREVKCLEDTGGNDRLSLVIHPRLYPLVLLINFVLLLVCLFEQFFVVLEQISVALAGAKELFLLCFQERLLFLQLVLLESELLVSQFNVVFHDEQLTVKLLYTGNGAIELGLAQLGAVLFLLDSHAFEGELVFELLSLLVVELDVFAHHFVFKFGSVEDLVLGL